MNCRTVVVALVAACMPIAVHAADPTTVARGKYLVSIAGCNDCHTPGYFMGKPDMTRYLGGSDVGFELPGLGVFVGPNLTPDKETGLGNWTDAQVVAAIKTGARPDGRMLAPIMPYHALANLTAPDVQAMVDFLRTLPAVQHKAPGPFGPSQTPDVFVMKLVPPPAR